MNTSENLDDPQLAAAAERFCAFPWEETYCADQESYETYIAVVRSGLRGELAQISEEISGLPFDQVNALLAILGFGAIREGARVFASFAGGIKDQPPLRPIPYDRLMTAAHAIADPLSPEAVTLRAQVEQMPELDWLVSSVQLSLTEGLFTRFPLLRKNEEAVRKLVLAGLLGGIRMEFLFPLLNAQVIDEDRLLEHAVKTISPRDDRDLAVIERWRKAKGKSEDVRPWPKNGHCTCGQSLTAEVQCCAQSAPLDTAALEANAGANFLLKRPCCGASLTGLRCATCARYYTWTRGVVDGFGEEE